MFGCWGCVANGLIRCEFAFCDVMCTKMICALHDIIDSRVSTTPDLLLGQTRRPWSRRRSDSTGRGGTSGEAVTDDDWDDDVNRILSDVDKRGINRVACTTDVVRSSGSALGCSILLFLGKESLVLLRWPILAAHGVAVFHLPGLVDATNESSGGFGSIRVFYRTCIEGIMQGITVSFAQRRYSQTTEYLLEYII